MNKRLDDESERTVRQGTAAWSRIKKEKNWNDWMAVGDALQIGRTFAMNDAGTNQPSGKGYNLAFNQFLIDARFDDMDGSDRAKLFTVMENRPAIEQWRATLTQTDRLRLNHPTSVLRKWQNATKEPKPPKPTLTDSVRALDEEQHVANDKIAELQRERDDLKARVAELEEENAGLRDRLSEVGKVKPAAVHQQDESAAAPGRKAKAAKGKTTKAKAAKQLEWNETTVTWNNDNHRGFAAPAMNGNYICLDINNNGASWAVFYSSGGDDRLLGNHRDLAKAKAAAQRDYDRGGE